MQREPRSVYQACWPAELNVLNSREASAGELEPEQVDMGRMSLHTVSCTMPSAFRKISTTLPWLSPDTMMPFTCTKYIDLVQLLLYMCHGSHGDPGTRRRGLWQTRYLMNDKRRLHRNTGKNIQTALTHDIYNNPPVTWGRTDYK